MSNRVLRPVYMLADGMAFFAAFQLAVYARYYTQVFFTDRAGAPWDALWSTYPLLFGVFWCVGLAVGSYHTARSVFHEAWLVCKTAVLAFTVLLATTFFYRGFSYSRGMALFLVPSVVLCTLLGRWMLRAIEHRARHAYQGRVRVVLVGRSALGRTLLKSLLRNPDYHVVARIDTQEHLHQKTYHTIPVVGHMDHLDALCEQHAFDSLIIVDRNIGAQHITRSLEICMKHHISWNIVPAEYELLLDRPRVEWVDGIPLIGTRRSQIVGVNLWIKRVVDIVGASVLLVLCAPLMVCAALAIKAASKGPVFYVQQRVGYKGRLFSFIKFRTMYVNNDDSIHQTYMKEYIANENKPVEIKGEKIHKLVDDPRVFKVGRWMRMYSVDELPQLLNVLKGDMSLVGPRPALPYEVALYSGWHRKRFEAPPGITGLWQVSGRNKVSFDQMVRLDIQYLEHWGFWWDVEILCKTIKAVLVEKTH